MNPSTAIHNEIATLTQKIAEDKARLRDLKKTVPEGPAGIDDRMKRHIAEYYRARNRTTAELYEKEREKKDIVGEIHYLQTHSHIVHQFVKNRFSSIPSLKIQEETKRLEAVNAEIVALKEQLSHPVDFVFQGWFEVKDWNFIVKKHVFGKRFFGFDYNAEDEDDLEESLQLLERPCQFFTVDADTIFVYGKTEEGGAFEYVFRPPPIVS